VADAIELIEFLRQHLGVDKVVMLAESMGTLTGLPLVKRRPDLVHALVATDLYVNMAANEARKYQLTLERLRAANNPKAVAALERIGPDPTRWNLRAWNTKMAWAFRTNVPTPNLYRRLLFPLALTSPIYSLSGDEGPVRLAEPSVARGSSSRSNCRPLGLGDADHAAGAPVRQSVQQHRGDRTQADLQRQRRGAADARVDAVARSGCERAADQIRPHPGMMVAYGGVVDGAGSRHEQRTHRHRCPGVVSAATPLGGRLQSIHRRAGESPGRCCSCPR
jgi:pimeloyl-ACP methyl ester carboxylesterase